MAQYSAVRILAFGIAAVLIAGIAAYVVVPRVALPTPMPIAVGEPPIPNRTAKTDRLALSSSYTTYSYFSPSLSFPTSHAFSAPDRHPHLSDGIYALLNDAQIAGIKSRLRLTPNQAEHWPAVGEALRDIARRYFQQTSKKNAPPKIDVNSPEVQRLIAVTFPLLQQLREDQKREVRELVRMIGLGTVASHL